MQKLMQRTAPLVVVLAAVLIGGSAVLALPSEANGHAQAAATGSTDANKSTPQSNAQARIDAARLRACQNRQHAINTIMTRIDTRAQNQITLFGTISTRVENFYVQKGKTVSNYDQLVAAVVAAKTQANNDFSTTQNSGSFSCTVSSPKGTVTAFQSYLKQEISDLQSYRTAVKNLIVGVAKAQGITLSSTSQSTGQEGGQ